MRPDKTSHTIDSIRSVEALGSRATFAASGGKKALPTSVAVER